MTERRDTLIGRMLRRFTLGSGPLKRRSDRLQVIGRVVVAVSLLLAPPLAVAAVTATTVQLHAVAETEAADRSRVSAVLLVDAPALVSTSGAYSSATVVRVHVRAVWPAPDGTSREGDVLAAPLTPAGTAVPVWVDRAGRVVRAPLDPSGIGTSANLTGVLVLLGLPLTCWALYAFLCFVLDERRDRRWERNWAAVEPEWTSRLL
jgi:hypothetical protein